MATSNFSLVGWSVGCLRVLQMGQQTNQIEWANVRKVVAAVVAVSEVVVVVVVVGEAEGRKGTTGSVHNTRTSKMKLHTNDVEIGEVGRNWCGRQWDSGKVKREAQTNKSEKRTGSAKVPKNCVCSRSEKKRTLFFGFDFEAHAEEHDTC